MKSTILRRIIQVVLSLIFAGLLLGIVQGFGRQIGNYIFWPIMEYVGWASVDKPLIAIALSYSGSDVNASDEVLKGAKKAKEYFCNSNGRGNRKLACSVDIDEPDDSGDQAQAKRVANRIMNNSSVVAVIGHLSSSVTEAAINEYCTKYYGFIQRSITIVMPVPTATSLVSQARALGCKAILRLPPTNTQQAEKAANFLARIPSDQKGSQFILGILRDQNNPTYSNNFGTQITSRLDSEMVKAGRRYVVAFNVAVGGETGGFIVTQEIRLFDLNALFIAGMTDVVLQTLFQAKTLKWTPKNIVLTDGALAGKLAKQGEDILNENTYLIFPIALRDKVRDLHVKIGLRPDEISFAGYGFDSMLLILHAIDQLDREGIKLTRRSVEKLISSWATTTNALMIQNDFVVSPEGYSFDEWGNNLHPVIGLFQYQKLKKNFVPIFP
jgi:hypothetical protein